MAGALSLWTEELALYSANTVADRGFPRSYGAEPGGSWACGMVATGLGGWESVFSSVKWVLDQGPSQSPGWLPALKMVFGSGYGMARKRDELLRNRKSLPGELSGLDLKLVISHSWSPATLLLAGTSLLPTVPRQVWVPALCWRSPLSSGVISSHSFARLLIHSYHMVSVLLP